MIIGKGWGGDKEGTMVSIKAGKNMVESEKREGGKGGWRREGEDGRVWRREGVEKGGREGRVWKREGVEKGGREGRVWRREVEKGGWREEK